MPRRLRPELEDLREMLVEFAEREVKPVLHEYDSRPDPKDCYPVELVRKASKLGLRTLALPKEWGGEDADTMTKTLVLTTLSEYCSGFAKIFSQCWKVTHMIKVAGTKEQQEYFFSRFVADDEFVCSQPMSEPNATSDTILPYNDPKAGMQTRGVKDGDHWVITGVKDPISLAGISKLHLTYVRTNFDVPAREGATAFLIPADLPGISYGGFLDKMGVRLYPQGRIYYDNVRVPEEFILGGVNKGFQIQQAIFRGNLEMPARYVGICKGMYRRALEYAETRVQGGKPIIGHDNVSMMLAEMQMLIDVMETQLWDLAEAVDHDPDYHQKRTRFGKIFSSQAALRVMYLAMDICGATAITRGDPLEKMIRDALTWLHGDGTLSLNMLRVANYIRNDEKARYI